MGGLYAPRPHWTGKAASGLTMAVLAWILAFRSGTTLSNLAPVLIWIDAGLIVVSGFRYLWMGLMYLQALDEGRGGLDRESGASGVGAGVRPEGKVEGWGNSGPGAKGGRGGESGCTIGSGRAWRWWVARTSARVLCSIGS